MTVASPAPALNIAAEHCQIAICGAGPVGMACAALLVAEGYAPDSIVLIDSRSLEESKQDPRSLALSDGSRRILQAIQGWTPHTTAIRQIHVSRRGYPGRTLIDTHDYQLDALGYVARYGDVVAALADSPLLRDVRNYRSRKVTGMHSLPGATGTSVVLSTDQGELHAGLVIQAEGRTPLNSTEASVPSAAGTTLRRDYAQTAIVAHVTCSRFQSDRAFERFTDEGPLALLPQNQGYSMVWCVRHENVAPLMALGDADFLAALQQRFGERAGQFLTVSPRHTFALSLHRTPDHDATALVLPAIHIGNAAQTLHPVAGQGLNLGLRDARHLTRWLALHTHSAQGDLLPVLQSYLQQRKHDRGQTVGLTDLMARIFVRARPSNPNNIADNQPDSLVQSALGLSLSAIDALGPVRHRLARQMMYGG